MNAILLRWKNKITRNKNNDNNNEDNNNGSSRIYGVTEREKLEYIRLIERNLPFSQSKNKIRIENRYGTSSSHYYHSIYKLLWHDWYHVLIRCPLIYSFSMLIILWTVSILFFAGLYYGFDRINSEQVCGLGSDGGAITWRASFAFSLQTCTTVGYTLPSGSNAFFENCPEIQIPIFLQMVWSMICNAFLFAFFYARIAKCDSRGIQVMFSQQALVSIHTIQDMNQKQRQQVRFQVRVYDISSGQAPVVEAHVRMYAVLKNDPDQQLRLLRLLQPNDSMGGMLFLSTPTVVSHPIDLYSVLHPPHIFNTIPPPPPNKQQRPFGSAMSSVSKSSSPIDNDNDDENTTQPEQQAEQHNVMLPFPPITTSHGLGIRSADSRIGSRKEIICPICSESYGTVEQLISHVKYYKVLEDHDEWDDCDKSTSCHSYISDDYLNYVSTIVQPVTDIQGSIQKYFQENVSEIIVIVEGIEPTVSGSFSSVQSYRYEDIVFHESAYFRPCIRRHTIRTSSSVSAASPRNGSTKKNKRGVVSLNSNTNQDHRVLQIDLDAFHAVDFDGDEDDENHKLTAAAKIKGSYYKEDTVEPNSIRNFDKQFSSSSHNKDQLQQVLGHPNSLMNNNNNDSSTATSPRVRFHRVKKSQQQLSLRYHDSFFDTSESSQEQCCVM